MDHMPETASSNRTSNLISGSRTRRTMRLVGWNLLTAAVLLIPIELGLRLFDFEFALAPPRVEFGWPDPVTMERSFTVDPDLLWVRRGYSARVAAARGQRPSMVFMGDSSTEWGRYDEYLQSIVEARDPGSGFTFVNLGVGGWSSWSGLQQLQRDVRPIRPRAVTIYYGWNDHWKHFGLQDKDAARFLEEPSALRTVQLADKALFGFRQLFADPGPYRVSLADFRDNLRQMVRIARDDGIVPILLTAPTSHRRGREPAYLAHRRLTNLDDLVPLHRRYVQAVREAAEEEEALLVDLHEQFNRLPRHDLEQYFEADGIHLTPEGDRKTAELIDRRLVQANLYPRIIERGFDTEAEEHLQEAIDNARLLVRGRFDVWLDGDRLLYVKDRCVGSDEEQFSLHVVPVDPDDLPEHRREHGFDNRDFDFSRARVNSTRRCVVSQRLPDYPVAAIRTGQFRFEGENGFNQLWEGEFIFTEGRD